jgi:hypothetical protein
MPTPRGARALEERTEEKRNASGSGLARGKDYPRSGRSTEPKSTLFVIMMMHDALGNITFAFTLPLGHLIPFHPKGGERL